MKIKFTESLGQLNFILQDGSSTSESLRFSVPQKGCISQSLSHAKAIIVAKVQQVFSKEHAFQKFHIENSANRFQVKLISKQQALSPFIKYQLKRILTAAFKNPPLDLIVDAESEIGYLASLRGKASSLLQPEVYEFLKRLISDELKELVKEITRVSTNAAKSYEEMLFKTRKGKAIKDPDWPYFALLAFAKGDLNVMEVSQVLLLYETMRASGQQKLPLFTLKDEHNIEYLLTSLDVILSEEDKDTLRIQLKKLPLTEAIFTYIDTPLEPDTAKTDDERARSQLLYFFDNVFKHDLLLAFPNATHYRQLVISPRIAYEIGKVKYGAHYMIPNPVIGYSKSEDFADKDLRDVYIPCPKVHIPKDIHGLQASALSMYHHDIAYHYFIDSANPHREAWLELAHTTGELSTLLPQETLSSTLESLLDRDLPFYLDTSLVQRLFSNPKQDSSTLFWSSFVTFFSNAEQLKDKLELFFRLLQHIWMHREEWRQKHGIDYQDVFALKALSREEFQSDSEYDILESRFPLPESLHEGLELVTRFFEALQNQPLDFAPNEKPLALHLVAFNKLQD